MPPIFIDFVRKIYNKKSFERGFDSWDSALSRTTSYNTEDVFQKTLVSSRMVRDGVAVYERDSVIFDKVQYDWQLLSSLMFISNIKNRLYVADFGGALGTSYRQNKKFLDCLSIDKKWAVIEQEKFVKIGKEEFENNELYFYESLSTIDFEVDVVLMGGSICYFENPYNALDEIKLLKPKFLLITRTPFSSATEDEISIQHVPKTTYNASFPIRTFSEEKFKKYLSDMYDVFEHWEDTLQADDDAVAKGILFIIKDVVK